MRTMSIRKTAKAKNGVSFESDVELKKLLKKLVQKWSLI